MNDKIEDSPRLLIGERRKPSPTANILKYLPDEALKGKLRCAACKNGDAGNGHGNEINVYYKDCLSEVKVIIRIHDFL